MDTSKPLLIFDLDETLIYASSTPLLKRPNFIFDKYSIYFRPHLEDVLSELSIHFLLAVWSSAGDEYVETVTQDICSWGIRFEFVWGYSRCTPKYDPQTGQYHPLKNLKKVKRKGYSLSKALIVDNTPSKVSANYGNAIYIKDFLGDENDQELILLMKYLLNVKDEHDYRRIEKRNWRST